ncbi:hypothetical protein [Acinetobacter baumannii]|uniref:hypothetical protein n=1 Tax=Acinetobacter baumannii TaxID=470 RepID=UPI001D12E52D|nr:hypothetical protein [Acinetobacter baumannii]MCC0748792.1 hypothetical protein [Acinetobacter baumannii]
MSECNKADHQIDPLELFEIFFTSITPEMTPIGIRSHGMQATHHFWKQRFLNVFRGIPEDKGPDQFSDLPILWLSAWKHQQEKVEEMQVQLKGAQERAQLVLQYKDKYRLERDDLQKLVEHQGLVIAKAMSIASDLQKSWATFEIGKKLEQALKVQV